MSDSEGSDAEGRPGPLRREASSSSGSSSEPGVAAGAATPGADTDSEGEGGLARDPEARGQDGGSDSSDTEDEDEEDKLGASSKESEDEEEKMENKPSTTKDAETDDSEEEEKQDNNKEEANENYGVIDKDDKIHMPDNMAENIVRATLAKVESSEEEEESQKSDEEEGFVIVEKEEQDALEKDNRIGQDKQDMDEKEENIPIEAIQEDELLPMTEDRKSHLSSSSEEKKAEAEDKEDLDENDEKEENIQVEAIQEDELLPMTDNTKRDMSSSSEEEQVEAADTKDRDKSYEKEENIQEKESLPMTGDTKMDLSSSSEEEEADAPDAMSRTPSPTDLPTGTRSPEVCSGRDRPSRSPTPEPTASPLDLLETEPTAIENCPRIEEPCSPSPAASPPPVPRVSKELSPIPERSPPPKARSPMQTVMQARRLARSPTPERKDSRGSQGSSSYDDERASSLSPEPTKRIQVPSVTSPISPAASQNRTALTKIYTEALGDSDSEERKVEKVARSRPAGDITQQYTQKLVEREELASSPKMDRKEMMFQRPEGMTNITQLYTAGLKEERAGEVRKPMRNGNITKLYTGGFGKEPERTFKGKPNDELTQPRKHNMATSVDKAAIMEAYTEVQTDKNGVEWAAFVFTDNTLGVTAKGVDFDEFKSKFGPDDRGFGYIKIMTGDEMSKRSKFVFCTWVGPNVSVMKKAKMSTDRALMKDIIQNISVELQPDTAGEFTLEYFKAEVDKAGGANYGTGIRD